MKDCGIDDGDLLVIDKALEPQDGDIVVALFNDEATVDWSIIGDTKELIIKGSQLSPYCYPVTIENIADGKAPTAGVVTHRFPLDQWQEAFRTAESKEAIKVIIVP